MYLQESELAFIIKTLKKALPNLQALYLFGSFNDGSAHAKSDVDIAFLSPDIFDKKALWDIQNHLASLLNRDIDLIDLKETNTIFRYQILSTASRLFGEGYQVESFETLAYSFYLRFQEERKPIVDALYGQKEEHHV